MNKSTTEVKTLLVALFVIWAGSISMSGAAVGQSGSSTQIHDDSDASLSETIAWLKGTFPDGSVSEGSDDNVKSVRFKGLNLEDSPDKQCRAYVFTYFGYGAKPAVTELLQLGDLDPSSIRTSSLIHDYNQITRRPSDADDGTGPVKDHPYVVVTVNTANNADTICVHEDFPVGDHTEPLNVHSHTESFALKPDYAPRFVKALTHAVHLCGGKPSPF